MRNGSDRRGAGRRTAARALRGVVAAAALVALTACSPVMRYNGYAPTDAELAALTVGRDTQETVAAAVGRPTSGGLLAGGAWYYVQSDWEHAGWRAPREVDRQVVAIRFDEDGVLANIERFGLEDGQVVVLSQRVTDDQVQGISLARQLFRNLGRFSAAAVADPLTGGL